jgi:hypothetical protein
LEIKISDEVPEDFHRAITVEEANIQVIQGIREMFKMKREQKQLYNNEIVLFIKSIK